MTDAVPDLDWYLDHVVVPGGPSHEPVGPIRTAQAAWAARARELSQNGDAAARAAVAQGFVLTPAQTRAAGLADTVVRGRVRRGEWGRPRHGVLAVVPTGDGTRLALAATAAVLVRPGHVISHRSAAVLHGLPLLGRPDVPELTGPAEATHGRRYALAVRPATLTADDVTTWYGAAVTPSPGP